MWLPGCRVGIELNLGSVRCVAYRRHVVLQVQSEGSLRTAYETLNEFIVFCRDTAAKVRPVAKHQYLAGNTETWLVHWPCLI
jgi:hypothetical protein